MILPITTNSNSYYQYNHSKKNNNPAFTGLVNSCTKRVFARHIALSKNRRLPIIPELANNLKIVNLKVGKNTCEAFDINPNNSNKYIIFYHGIGQNITSNQEIYKSIIQKGYGVFAAEYCGFGNSNGNLSSKSIKKNVKSVVNYLTKNNKIKHEDIGIVGHSLGSFPAIEAATRNQKSKFLILISPLNSLKNEIELLTQSKTVKLPQKVKVVIKKFPSLLNIIDRNLRVSRKIKSIKAPLYLIHSKDDKIISTTSTRDLAKKSNNLKKLIILNDGQHTIDCYKINAFENLFQGIN